MKRIPFTPRPYWREQCESLGFGFHSIDGLYWEERYAYAFTSQQIDALDDATAECHALCMAALDHVVSQGRYESFGLAPQCRDLIESSWRRRAEPDQFDVYSRFDFSWNGVGAPKLLEYNADTPTGLLEASVIQWYWLQDVMPRADQFNSIHEKLIARWQHFARLNPHAGALHFACAAGSEEDMGNLLYLQDTAVQAGLISGAQHILTMSDIGWDADTADFCDLSNDTIHTLFKLYPWEWLLKEQFADSLMHNQRASSAGFGAQSKQPCQWIEPAYKVLLSSKALLPVLWELFPNHPNLLPAYFDNTPEAAQLKAKAHAKKPLYSREGANVSLKFSESLAYHAPGDYGQEGYIIQGLAPLPQFGDHHTCIGSWLVGGVPAGIGIREDFSPITKDTSLFVPHCFLD